MTIIQLTGEITEDGELHIELPSNLPVGKVQVTIEVADDAPITPEELAELMRVEPMTGAEIVAAGLTGGWEHLGITDGAEWVQEQRRKRRVRRASR